MNVAEAEKLKQKNFSVSTFGTARCAMMRMKIVSNYTGRKLLKTDAFVILTPESSIARAGEIARCLIIAYVGVGVKLPSQLADDRLSADEDQRARVGKIGYHMNCVSCFEVQRASAGRTFAVDTSARVFERISDHDCMS